MKRAVIAVSIILSKPPVLVEAQVVYKGKPIEYWVDQVAAGNWIASDAWRAFKELHCSAAPAVPRLVELLKTGKSGVQQDAAHALGAIGVVSALPALTERLTSPDRSHRLYACGAIEDIVAAESGAMTTLGDRPPRCTDPSVKPTQTLAPTMQPLINLLRDDDENAASCAHRALAKMGAAPVASLVSAAQDLRRPLAVRASAARVLGIIGPAAIDALPALKALVSKPGEDALIRGEANAAILKIERRER